MSFFMFKKKKGIAKNANVCDNCKDIKLYESFDSPRQYEDCVNNMRQLLETGNFKFIGGAPLDKIKEENGCWVDDCIDHKLRCKACGQCFFCFVDTYHGRGSFKRVGKD